MAVRNEVNAVEPQACDLDGGHCGPCIARQRIWRGMAMLVALSLVAALVSTLMTGRA